MFQHLIFSFLVYGSSLGLVGYILFRWIRGVRSTIKTPRGLTMNLKAFSPSFVAFRSVIFIRFALIGIVMCLLVYPIEALRKLIFTTSYPLFKLDNIKLIDDSRDFIEVTFSSDGTALGIYWDETEHQFLFQPLELDKQFTRKNLRKTRTELSVSRPSLTVWGAERFSDTSGNIRYSFTKNSPWVSLPLVQLSAQQPYRLVGNWVTGAGPRPLTFEFAFIPLEQANSPSLSSLQAKKALVHPVRAVGLDHRSAISMLTLYTLSSNYLYYTTLHKNSQRYSIQTFPIPNTKSSLATSVTSEKFLSQTNTGHHYYPFYWAERDLLTYLSVERVKAEELEVIQTGTSNGGVGMQQYRFQTLLNVKNVSGELLYKKPLFFTERPQLTRIKVEGDTSGSFIGYTSPTGEGVLYFMYVGRSSTNGNFVAGTAFTPFIPFELRVPEMRAIHSFTFTPMAFISGVLFIGIPAITKSGIGAKSMDVRGSVYWGEIITTSFFKNPLSFSEVVLVFLCITLALVILGYIFLYRSHFLGGVAPG